MANATVKLPASVAWLDLDAVQTVTDQPSAHASGSAPTSAGGDQEAELLRTIEALRKDVANAQELAAQEAGHVVQYRILAEGAEENTKIVQVRCIPLHLLSIIMHIMAALVPGLSCLESCAPSCDHKTPYKPLSILAVHHATLLML